MDKAVLEFKPTHANKDHDTKLWVVASGKGGVGKTFVSSSLGMTLSKLGHSVVIVDLDLSGSNIHTVLGLNPSHMNIRHYFEGAKTLQELVIPTPYPHLSYVQGFWDSWTPTDFSHNQIQSLIPQLKNLRADYVIVDLGAGALEAHLELFKVADEKFLITTPEPTSIEKTYRFIESFMCYSLRENSTPDAYGNMISTLRNHRQRTLSKPFSFRSYLKEETGIHYDFFEALSSTPVRLLVNTSRNQANDDLGHSMKSVCNKYYDLGIDYIGAIDYDNAVWQSVRVREHVLVAQPFTPLAGQFLATCKQLIAPEELRAVV
ncbi:P-loop NTPase [Bdellovibrio bacteriovorus]|uniref:Putative ATP-binding protein n=1 Tax=Bdellovibrio bacteriovorus (strain ATCC 15356 / DSM 50701 / NCIMB 9529 / HD100) TaxID=264462 RepID=Q6MGY0_BDEBA|nr:P-loop NTPase [Bdellovibrio bacteriovorus]AHZ85544.1 ATP-binding protein [Bdellovibrio bacteriovorus]BEV70091.1 Iron-sulfur cluster carrier protein [Bdellovibrio bacteriovorus]CAE81149.1 putative ATP-binding protein [Bdellovibrio bacteriovorus HD100]